MITLPYALRVSSDTFFYQVADLLYKAQSEKSNSYPLMKEAARFGLGHDTGIDLPGEVSALVPDPLEEAPLRGQGLHRLPAQLARRRHHPARGGPGVSPGDAAADGRRLRRHRRRRHHPHSDRRARGERPSGRGCSSSPRVAPPASSASPRPTSRRSSRASTRPPTGPTAPPPACSAACPRRTGWPARPAPSRPACRARRITPGTSATRRSTTRRSWSRSSSSTAGPAPTPPRRRSAPRWPPTSSSIPALCGQPVASR